MDGEIIGKAVSRLLPYPKCPRCGEEMVESKAWINEALIWACPRCEYWKGKKHESPRSPRSNDRSGLVLVGPSCMV